MVSDADQDRLRIGSSLTLEALAEQVMDLARQVGVKLAPPTVSWSRVPPNPNETLGTLLLDEATNRVVRRIRFSGPVKAAIASRVRYRQAMRVGRAARRTAKGMARGAKAGALIAMQAPQILLSLVVLVLIVGLLYYLWVGARKVEWLTGEIVPSAAACGAGIRPAGFLWFGDQDDGSGTSFVDFTGAMGGWVSDKLDLSTEGMIRGVHWTVETSGSVVATAQHTLQGGNYLPPSTGTAPQVVPSAFGAGACCSATGSGTGTATAGYLQPVPVQGPAAGGLSAEQARNVQAVIAVGKTMGVPARGQLAALEAIAVESEARNVPYGDRDSLGLFQQRPSQGWGTAAQVQNPTYAATAFYTALLQVPDWPAMSPGQAAQKVQRSAFPDRYDQRQGEAQRWLTTYGGVGASLDAQPIGGECIDGGVIAASNGGTVTQPTTTGVATAIEFARDQLGEPYRWGGNGPDSWDCSGLINKAFNLPGRPNTRGLVRMGTPVPSGAIRAGDLIFPSISTNAGHVGIALGDGTYIHAPQTGDVVKISRIPSNPEVVRRLVPAYDA